jgi:hypothetical protein
LQSADQRGIAAVHWVSLPDQIRTREEIRTEIFGPNGGQFLKAVYKAGRVVNCRCEEKDDAIRMSAHIEVQDQFILSTDEGNERWPPLWQQRIEEGIHQWEMRSSFASLMKLAEQHEQEQYRTLVGCEIDAWRLRNNSWVTKCWHGFAE